MGLLQKLLKNGKDEKRFTYAEVGRQTGICRVSIHLFATKGSIPREQWKVDALAAYFNVTPEEIDPPKPPKTKVTLLDREATVTSFKALPPDEQSVAIQEMHSYFVESIDLK